MQSNDHRALITWSEDLLRLGLPDISQTIDPVVFGVGEDAWSLICRFERSPKAQGNPSEAQVRFLMDGASHERLVACATLRMFERWSMKYATITVVD